MAEFVELFKSSHEALKRQSTVTDAVGQDSGSRPWLRPGRLFAPPCGIDHLHIRAWTLAAVAFEKLTEGIDRRMAPLRRRSVVIRSFLTCIG